MRIVTFIFVLGSLVSAAPAQAPASPDFERLSVAARDTLARDGNGAVSIGLVRDGRLVSSAHFGTIDPAGRTLPDDRTLYRIGSVTKAFTAVMLMQLEERGLVRLSDPAVSLVPELRRVDGRKSDVERITLFQLATHTSGLSAEPSGKGFDKGGVDRWEQLLLAALPSVRVEGEPGVRFSYSNVGYAVLALALSRAAKRPYVDHVLDEIVRPMGMADTVFEPTATQRRRLAIGIEIEKGAPTVVSGRQAPAGRGYKVPAGGLYSTTSDLARFVAFQMGNGNPTVLKPATLERASRLLIAVDRGMGEGYGLGFQLFTNGDAVLQGHTGGLPGYRSVELFDREARTGFIVLRNVIGGRFGDPVMLVFNAYPPASGK